MKSNIVWKTNSQTQLSLLPPSYDDFVPEHHPVRIVNSILNQIDIRSIENTYKGGGTSSYHPRDLLKILIYAYLRNLYSSRKIEQALGENVHLCGLVVVSNPIIIPSVIFVQENSKGILKRYLIKLLFSLLRKVT